MTTWQVAYREIHPPIQFQQIANLFNRFCEDLANHEHAEMELMTRLCKEIFGIDD